MDLSCAELCFAATGEMSHRDMGEENNTSASGDAPQPSIM